MAFQWEETSKSTGLISTLSRLTLPIKPRHFRSEDGHLAVKCLASMLTMHWQSLDVRIAEESPTLLAASIFDEEDGTSTLKGKKSEEEQQTSSGQRPKTHTKDFLPKVMKSNNNFINSSTSCQSNHESVFLIFVAFVVFNV